MGSVPQGILGVILNSGAGWSEIHTPLQTPPMRHSGWIFGRAMCERKRTKPVRWRETMSFPTTRIIQIRHGVPCFNRQCVTPASEPESHSSSEGVKSILTLFDPSNYAIPGRIWIIRVVGKLIVSLHLTGLVIWIIRVVGKLIVSLHLTGLVRIRSLIALPKIQPK